MPKVQTQTISARTISYPVAAVLVLLGLYWARIYSYNLFHSVAEMFSVVVFFSVFVIAYNARRFLDNNYFLALGAGYAFVAAVDILHMLAYKGMGIFPDATTNLPTQLWLTGRFLQTGALLIAPFFAGRATVRIYRQLGIWSTVTVILLSAIFLVPIFPDAFMEGEGLTVFKIWSEYAISTGLILSLILLARIRNRFEPLTFFLISGSILTTIASELLFTLYTDPYGPANLAGHYLSIVAVFLAYKALVEAALIRPYGLLFRGLKQSEQAERRSKETYRDIADSLQHSLLTVPPEIPGLSLGYLYRSATHSARVGGDLYDVFRVDGKRVGIVIGDVSGKGLPAATLTTVVKDTIRAYAYEDISPASVMTRANRTILRSSDDSSWVSAFFAVLDPDRGSMVYCTAGHPPPLLLRRGPDFDTTRVTPLPGHSPILGGLPDLTYEEHRVELETGDLLLLYTDGVIEARRDGELYGEERLLTLVRNLGGAPASRVPTLIYEEIDRFAEGRLTDDVALLAVGRDPNLSPEGTRSPRITRRTPGPLLRRQGHRPDRGRASTGHQVP